jgi:hypothetical protein
LKAEAKQALKAGDMSLYAIKNAQQELEKLKLNSLYGKFGFARLREATDVITSDKDYVMQLLGQGLVNDVKIINDRYISFSGYQVADCSRTNFALAAYITARGRM